MKRIVVFAIVIPVLLYVIYVSWTQKVTPPLQPPTSLTPEEQEKIVFVLWRHVLEHPVELQLQLKQAVKTGQARISLRSINDSLVMLSGMSEGKKSAVDGELAHQGLPSTLLLKEMIATRIHGALERKTLLDDDDYYLVKHAADYLPFGLTLQERIIADQLLMSHKGAPR